jgi:hypothetical protein
MGGRNGKGKNSNRKRRKNFAFIKIFCIFTLSKVTARLVNGCKITAWS